MPYVRSAVSVAPRLRVDRGNVANGKQTPKSNHVITRDVTQMTRVAILDVLPDEQTAAKRTKRPSRLVLDADVRVFGVGSVKFVVKRFERLQRRVNIGSAG